ncbi:MAG: DUF935 family protein [Armatimonadetes bacterium]|nr:DUF935 family protein [Armatimonadota bacterium]
MWQFWNNKISATQAQPAPFAPATAPPVVNSATRTRTSGNRVSALQLLPLYEGAFDGASLPPGGGATIEKMRRDAQVRSCLTTKRLSVLSEDAHVYPANDSADAKRAARLVEETLRRLPGGIGAVVSGALDALATGYALGELVWDAENGYLAQIRWHDPRRFALLADASGAVVAIKPVGAGTDTAPIPRERFVLYTYQSRYGSPFGESDLIAAHEPWWRKQTLNRMWLSALDRFGTPPVVATIPTGFGQKMADDLAAQLARLQTESAITVPAGVGVTFDQQRLEPGAGFLSAVAYQDAQIARAVLGQELGSQAGTGAGSYALGKVHQAVGDDWIQSLRSDIAASLLSAQIARRITETFFGDAQNAPTITFPNLTDAELLARRETVGLLLSGKVVAPDEAWIRGWLGVPEGETQ